MNLPARIKGATKYSDAAISPAHDVIVGIRGGRVYAKANNYIATGKAGVDDASVLQTAADFIEKQGGGVIYVKPGKYVLSEYHTLTGSINACVELKTSTAIIGAGIGKTILQLDANTPATMLAFDSINYVSISNIELDGNKSNNADSGVDGNQCGILAVTSGIEHRIVRVKARNCVRQGVYLGAPQNRCYVEDIIVEGNGLEGLSLDKAIYFDCIGVKALNNGNGGIYVSTGALNDFIGSIHGGFYYDNAIAGIYLKNARHVKILGAKAVNNGVSAAAAGDGILAQNCEDIEVIAATAYNNYRNGVYFLNSTSCKVISGTMRNNRVGSAAADGVRTYDSQECQIIGVRAYDDRATKKQEYGFREAGTTDDYNIIANCNFRGNALGNVSTIGANTLISNNL